MKTYKGKGHETDEKPSETQQICKEGEVFCVERGLCVSNTILNVCQEKEVFCLEKESCMVISSPQPDNTCPQGKEFCKAKNICVANGTCTSTNVDKDGGDDTKKDDDKPVDACDNKCTKANTKCLKEEKKCVCKPGYTDTDGRGDCKQGGSNLTNVNVEYLQTGMSAEIVISGKHLEIVTLCKLQIKDNKELTLQTTYDKESDTLKAKTTGVVQPTYVGIYKLECTFTIENGSPANVTIEYEKDIEIYQLPTKITASTEVMTQGQQNLTVTLTSDIDVSLKAKCIMICSRMELSIGCRRRGDNIFFSTVRKTNRELECDLDKLAKLNNMQTECNLRILPVPLLRIAYDLPKANFRCKAKPLNLVKLEFGPSFCTLDVEFNFPIGQVTRCDQVFDDDTVNKFGSSARCKTNAKKLKVEFSPKDIPSLSVTDTVTVKGNAIQVNKAQFGTAYSGGAIKISDLSKPVDHEVEWVQTQHTIGSCSQYHLSVKTKRSCIKYTYSWSVKYAGKGTASDDVKKDLEDIQAYFNKLGNDTKVSGFRLTKDRIKKGETYEFKVIVKGSFNTGSVEKTFLLTRLPTEKKLSVTMFSIDSSEIIPGTSYLVKASVKQTGCDANDKNTNLIFTWSTDCPDEVKFSRETTRLPYNPVFGFVGGKKCTITVNVTDSIDNSITDSSSREVQPPSRPLELSVITRERSMDVTKLNKIEFDVTDPDNDKKTIATFSFSCLQGTKKDSINNECTDLKNIISTTKTRILELPANALNNVGNGLHLKITAKVTKGTRTAEKAFIVTMLNKTPPLIDTEYLVNAGVSDGVVISNYIEYFGGKVEFFYICESDGSDCSQVGNWNEEPFTPRRLSYYYYYRLYIDPYQLPPGDYLLTLTVQSQEDTTIATSADTNLVIHSDPVAGQFQITVGDGSEECIAGQTLIHPYAENWSDESGKLKYSIHYQNERGEVFLLEDGVDLENPTQDDRFKFFMLAGKFIFWAEACNENGRCVSVESDKAITCKEKKFTKQEAEDLAKKAEEFVMEDLPKARQILMSVAEDAVEDEGAKALIVKIKKNVMSGELDSAKDIQDRAMKSVVLSKVLGLLTESTFSDEMAINFMEVAGSIIIIIETETGLTRRKRSTGNGGSPTFQPISTNEVKTAMTTYSNIYTMKADNITTSEAQEFLTNITGVTLSRLCASPDIVGIGKKPVLIESKLLTLRFEKREMKDITNSTMNVTCGDCQTDYVKYPAMINYGYGIESTYSNWNCSDKKVCQDTCIASGQLSLDLVTALGYSLSERAALNLTWRSDIIMIKLINPETHVHLDVTTLSSPINLTMTASGDIDLTNHTLQCMWWTGSNWTADACNTDQPPQAGDNGTYTVTCSCYEVGYFGVFDGPLSEETTTMEATTTAMDTTTSTTELSTTTGPTTTEPSTTTEPLTTSGPTTTEPSTTTGPSTTSGPTTTEPSTTTGPSTTSGPTTTEPSTTTGPSTTSGPTTTEPSTTTGPSTTSGPTTTEPSTTTGPSTTSGPTTTEPSTTTGPSTTSGPTTTAASTTTGPSTTSGPTTTEPSTTTGPSTTSGPTQTTQTTVSASTANETKTTDQTTTTTTAPPATPKFLAKVTFKTNISIPFKNITDMKNFTDSITEQVAQHLNVDKTRIKDLTIREGSVIISFTLLGGSGTTTQSELQTLLDDFKDQLTNGTVVLKDPDGNPMAFVEGSFSAKVEEVEPEEKKKNHTVYIVIGVMCGLLLIVLLLILILFLIKRKNKRSSPRVTPTPQSDYAEKQQYNKNGVWVRDPTWMVDETQKGEASSSKEELIRSSPHLDETTSDDKSLDQKQKTIISAGKVEPDLQGPTVSTSPLPPKSSQQDNRPPPHQEKEMTPVG